jgi:hypothetical protein
MTFARRGILRKRSKGIKRVLVGIAVAVFVAAPCLYAVLSHSTWTQELTGPGHWKDQEQTAEIGRSRLG